MMRLLYITELWPGLEDILCRGMPLGAGMPAFIRPLERLVEQGHAVELLVIPQPRRCARELHIGPAWLKRCKVRFVSFGRVALATRHALRREKFDLVYCHGPMSLPGLAVARAHGAAVGVRLYGSLLEKKRTELPRALAALAYARYPLEALAFLWPKDFLICTDDGTGGDRLRARLRRLYAHDHGFHFLKNGHDPGAPDERRPTDVDLETPFVFYPARIEPWKRQEWAIEMVDEMHRLGHPVNLFLAGHVSSPRYFSRLKRRMGAHVHYLGLRERAEMRYLYRRAFAVGSFYTASNLGNVTIEALSAGALVVAADDRSMRGIVEDGVNGLLVGSPREGADRLVALAQSDGCARALRKRAADSARRNFVPWAERLRDELAILARHRSRSA